MCANLKANQTFYKYTWLSLLIEFLIVVFSFGYIASIIYYWDNSVTPSYLQFFNSSIATSPLALIYFLFLQYRQVRCLEFAPGKMHMIYPTRSTEYNLSELIFVQRPLSENDDLGKRDDIRILNKAGETLLDISSKWTEYRRLLSYLAEQNLYVSEFPIAGIGVEEGFLTQAVGDGIKLLILLMLILFLPTGIGAYGFWIAIPATLLFISLFIYWLRSS